MSSRLPAKRIDRSRLSPRTAVRGSHGVQSAGFAGFTLVELLVVIAILAVLAIITFSSLTYLTNGDRVAAGSRQVQSMLEGARDRAIKAGQPRGVRFIIDDTILHTVGSISFIGAPESYSEGLIGVVDNDLMNPPGVRDIFLDMTLQNAWDDLVARGLLRNGSQIRIGTAADAPPGTERVYTIQITPGMPQTYALTTDFSSGPAATPLRYSLQLEPTLLPNEETRLLPGGSAVDLDKSRLPDSWEVDFDMNGIPFDNDSDSNYMNILFSPQGTVIGNEAAAGLTHIVVRDRRDIDVDRALGHDELEGAEKFVSVSPQTGSITTHDIFYDGANPTGDPFKNAETGEVSK